MPSVTFLCRVPRTLQNHNNAVLEKMNGIEDLSEPTCVDADEGEEKTKDTRSFEAFASVDTGYNKNRQTPCLTTPVS